MSRFKVIYADRPNPTAHQASIRALARIAKKILEEKRLKALEERAPISCLNSSTEYQTRNNLPGESGL